MYELPHWWLEVDERLGLAANYRFPVNNRPAEEGPRPRYAIVQTINGLPSIVFVAHTMQNIARFINTTLDSAERTGIHFHYSHGVYAFSNARSFVEMPYVEAAKYVASTRQAARVA